MKALAILLVQGKGIQMRRLQNSTLCLPFTRHQALGVFLICLFCRGSGLSELHKLPEGQNKKLYFIVHEVKSGVEYLINLNENSTE